MTHSKTSETSETPETPEARFSAALAEYLEVGRLDRAQPSEMLRVRMLRLRRVMGHAQNELRAEQIARGNLYNIAPEWHEPASWSEGEE